MQPLVNWIAAHPLRCLVGTMLLSAAAFLLVFDPVEMQPRLEIDPSIEHLLPAQDADREVAERARATFGQSDAIIVAVRLGQVFTADNLQKVDELTRRFRALPDVRSVFSLATAPNIRATGDELDVSSFTEQARRDPSQIAAMTAQLKANPIYDDTLISRDGGSTAFALMLGDVEEAQLVERDYPALVRDAARQLVGEADIWVAGAPVAQAATSRALIKTMKFTIPAVFVVILALLLVAFRSVRAMLMAAASVATALLWTLAAAALLGYPMNLVTAIVPPLVITLGLSYSIYLLSAYFAALQDKSLKTPAQRTRWVINRSAVGLILSAGTTTASFLALLLNVLPAIREFAWLASIGSALGVLLSLTFLPAALQLVGTTQTKRPLGERMAAVLARRLASFDLKHRGLIIGGALALVPLGLFLARDVRPGSDYIKNFDERAQVRRDFETINTAFNGANLISILIDTHVNDALTDPALVRQVEALQLWLRQQPEVGSAISYVDHLKLINQSLHENDTAFFAIPGDPTMIKQLMVFGGSDDLKSVIDSRFRTALVSIRINVDGSEAVGALVRRIEERVRQMPAPLNGEVTGSPVLATRTVQEIASGQFESIAIATFAIWALLALMFTSARAGLIALLPTVVPVAIYFGTLGLFDITLSPTTSLIACIVIGIAVDDTIQFLARFNADARATGSETRAAKSALLAIIRPVTLSTVALCLGFLVFTGSELKSQVQFGTLSAFTLAMAWVMNVTLTPALGSRLRIVTLWDLLRLDLGQSPQHTIPLFSGLSLRQSRIFALMSKLESYRAGARVITQGDLARDMFVVVDGTLEAFLEAASERKTLATMGRGAVMGEAGYFGQRRTAHVDAMTPVRVLRFDSQDLERMRVRYPRIAATVYRNLNRIQAERLARATAMLRE
ncbi:MAG TPA: MMPL family transporter [Solimonas sp.]|nr:MMPL family transporter [Solimonas sp.]